MRSVVLDEELPAVVRDRAIALCFTIMVKEELFHTKDADYPELPYTSDFDEVVEMERAVIDLAVTLVVESMQQFVYFKTSDSYETICDVMLLQTIHDYISEYLYVPCASNNKNKIGWESIPPYERSKVTNSMIKIKEKIKELKRKIIDQIREEDPRHCSTKYPNYGKTKMKDPSTIVRTDCNVSQEMKISEAEVGMHPIQVRMLQLTLDSKKTLKNLNSDMDIMVVIEERLEEQNLESMWDGIPTGFFAKMLFGRLGPLIKRAIFFAHGSKAKRENELLYMTIEMMDVVVRKKMELEIGNEGMGWLVAKQIEEGGKNVFNLRKQLRLALECEMIVWEKPVKDVHDGFLYADGSQVHSVFVAPS